MSSKKSAVGAAKTQSQQTQSYQAAYHQLSSIAAELESGTTDLDQVLPLLTQAQEAYAVCKGRIDALRSALEEAPPESVQQAEETGDSEDSDF